MTTRSAPTHAVSTRGWIPCLEGSARANRVPIGSIRAGRRRSVPPGRAPRRWASVRRATEEDKTAEDGTSQDASLRTEPEPKKEEEKGLKEGQGTAIVTGAVSLLLGVAYLALTLWLDQRGLQLQPPPPEAYLP